MIVSTIVALASLALCLGAGIWIGHRFAVESGRVNAVFAQAFATLDTCWEDEVEATPPWDRNTVAGYADTAVCPCHTGEPGEKH